MYNSSWVDKEIVVYPHNWRPFINEKKWLDISNNTHEFQRYYAEWKKLDWKEYIYVKLKEIQTNV